MVTNETVEHPGDVSDDRVEIQRLGAIDLLAAKRQKLTRQGGRPVSGATDIDDGVVKSGI